MQLKNDYKKPARVEWGDGKFAQVSPGQTFYQIMHMLRNEEISPIEVKASGEHFIPLSINGKKIVELKPSQQQQTKALVLSEKIQKTGNF